MSCIVNVWDIEEIYSNFIRLKWEKCRDVLLNLEIWIG